MLVLNRLNNIEGVGQMQEMKQIKDLKKGDRVSGTNGGVIQIISLIKNTFTYLSFT